MARVPTRSSSAAPAASPAASSLNAATASSPNAAAGTARRRSAGAAARSRRSADSSPVALAATLRAGLRARRQLFGSWMSIGHPEIAAIFAAGRGDFLGIDLEHSTIDLSTAQQIIRVCHEHRRACLPRIFPGQLEHLRRLLDAGADGVILPMVFTRDDVDRANQLLRYPPEGKRSFGVAAAQGYGRTFDAYVRQANASLVLIAQVETAAAVDNIDDILAHPAIDGIMVGPYDLSGSLGLPGQLTHPRVVEACQRVVRACARKNISCGMHLVYPKLADVKRQIAAGFTFLLLGSDIFNLWQRSLETDAIIDATQPRPAA